MKQTPVEVLGPSERSGKEFVHIRLGNFTFKQIVTNITGISDL